jgi:hypothetical protein
MPFLTRDFAVFLGLVAFLVSGITATVSNDIAWGGQNASVVSFVENNTGEYEAVLPTSDVEATRPSRLSELTSKVADFLKTNNRLAVLDEEVDATPLTKEVVESAVEPGVVLTCPGYRTINPAWTPKGLQFDVVEGALIVYRQIEETKPVVSLEISSTSVATTSVGITREVVLQLPVRTFTQTKDACLLTDVVGIALDGSLIRNSDYSAYRIFGSETQIGYALDGFAIYGSATFSTDSCGGVVHDGEYRYYLNEERRGVLGCFSATPVSL